MNLGGRGDDEPERYGREMMPEGPQSDVEEVNAPARLVLSLIGDKWTTTVLYCLSIREVRRFNELQRYIPDISKKMLIQTLRALERDGLLERTVFAQVPPKTEYRLTDDGRRLREPIAELCAWATQNQSFLDNVLSRRSLVSQSAADGAS